MVFWHNNREEIKRACSPFPYLSWTYDRGWIQSVSVKEKEKRVQKKDLYFLSINEHTFKKSLEENNILICTSFFEHQLSP